MRPVFLQHLCWCPGVPVGLLVLRLSGLAARLCSSRSCFNWEPRAASVDRWT